ARKAAGDDLGRPLDCTFHDLKAKGISDYEGTAKDKQKYSGHKTESQVLVYDRKVKMSQTLDRKR
ncbi:integrase, partial [Salmonella enterica subsp. enterica serovar Enteritidis]|nr:integrase [Salmonella enterica subsp. enterica serovar Enteritidis]